MLRARRSILVCWVGLVLACSSSHGERRSDEAGEDAGVRILPDDTAGKGCKRDADCPNGRCAKKLAIVSADDAMDAPGGYCTTECTNDFECGRAGQCSVRANEEAGECLASCQDEADCRDGYTCVGSSRLLGVRLHGTCQPKPKTGQLGDRVAGRACGDDADCLGGTCASVSPLGKAYPGNYCTGRCDEDAECGAGGACLRPRGSADAGHCYERCETDSDCARSGYRCAEIGENLYACFPAPESLADGTAGRACELDADCGAGARCARELPFGSLGGYEVVDAPGGYCTQSCARDSECGGGAQCIAHGLPGGLCLGSCNSMADCREGYSCIAHGRDGADGRSVCIPLILE